jgi:O-antigen ligase
MHFAMALFAASTVVGVWAAPERASALDTAQVLVLGAAAYALTWMAARRRSAGGRAIQALLVVAGAAAAFYFLTQYRHLAVEAKLPLIDGLARRVSARFLQVDAWTPFPNSLATLLDGVIGAALGLALARGPVVGRLLGAGATIVMATALAAAASRGSLVAVAAAIGAGVWAGVRLPTPPLRVLAAVAAATALAVLGGAMWSSQPWWMSWAALAGRPDRLEVYGHAMTLLRDTPFTGIGAGDQFAASLSKYALLIQVPYLTYAHNLVLELWLELGLPGLAAWWALAMATAVAAVAGERAGLGWRFRGLWIGVLAVHLHGLSDARQSVDLWTWAPFFVLSGLLAAAVARHEVRVTRGSAMAPLVVAGLVVVVVVASRGRPEAAWHANLGAVAQAQADFAMAGEAVAASAADHFARAVAANPADASALRRLGLLELDADRHAEALGHLRLAFAADGASLPTRKAYGLAAMWTGDTELAANLLAGLPNITTELNAWSSWRRSRNEIALAATAARTSLAVDPSQTAVAEWLAALTPEAGAAAAPH